MRKIDWTDDAIEDLQELDKPIVKRILTKTAWLSHHFDNITHEPLSGDMAGTFKLRVGDWRVVYTFGKDVIIIQAIGHRSEIYR